MNIEWNPQVRPDKPIPKPSESYASAQFRHGQRVLVQGCWGMPERPATVVSIGGSCYELRRHHVLVRVMYHETGRVYTVPERIVRAESS